MSSRPVGMGAFANRTSLTSSYASHGAALRSSQAQTLDTQLAVFKSLLHAFALQHGDRIRRDPAFRAEFARMCTAIGVDPLAGLSSSATSGNGKGGGSKGWLATLSLGRDVETFYHRIGVRVIEVCRASRASNGGLLALSELRAVIAASSSSSSPSSPPPSSSPSPSHSNGASSSNNKQQQQLLGGGMDVSDADIERAVEALAPLGSGYRVVEIAGTKMVRSVPRALNTDQTVVLEALHVLGSVSVSLLVLNLGWEAARCATVVEDLLADSLVWVDMKSSEREYWSPAFLAGADE